MRKPNKPSRSWNSLRPSQKSLELNEFFMQMDSTLNQRGNPSEDYRPGPTAKEMQDMILRRTQQAERERKLMEAEKRMRAGPDHLTSNILKIPLGLARKGDRLKKRGK